ncbi:sigma-70 family RNA polymerase sigma factor [Sphingomonas sp. ASV193]|uniref:sigma-70 family RNA polymerase sigma factor n=1 Tax=Sphingomonas sp. ASV193 TaxID=3144405 RepID=UPI0032E93180
MQRVGRGDALAFRALVDRHAARPYRVAWRMLGDSGEAEDVAQEAMLRLWRDGARWDGRGAGVGAWLACVASRLSIDRLRRRGRTELGEVPERADEAPRADRLIVASEESERVRRALAALPDRQRAAVVLTYYEELSNAAAAEAMELKLKAFESMLHRARAALRTMLIEETVDG